MVAGCHTLPYEAYGFEPDGPARPPLLADASVRVIDISRDDSATFEDTAATELPACPRIGAFTALNREGMDAAPVVPVIQAEARARGADAVIMSCGATSYDGGESRICFVVTHRCSP